MKNKMIGIVGGIGSYAGINLIKKIYDLTNVTCDQEHLPVSMLSTPHKITDRTDFLLKKSFINPGIAIADIINTLTKSGASIIGIPCNTAHAPDIFNAIRKKTNSSFKIVHLIEEVGQFLNKNHNTIKKVGILGTTGTIITKIYPKILQKYNIKVINPSKEIQDIFVHPSIYNKKYGIKAFSNPVNTKAINDLISAGTYLSRKGAEAIILGCTEIPLAIQQNKIENSLIINATEILAKALIKASYQQQ